MENRVILLKDKRRGDMNADARLPLAIDHTADRHSAPEHPLLSTREQPLDSGTQILREILRLCDDALSHFEKKGDCEGYQRLDGLVAALVSMIAADMARNGRI